MCTYINFFSARRYIVLTAIVSNFVSVVQMNKIVRNKSHIGRKFSKIFFEQLYTGWIVVVNLCCGFFCVASDGATTERQI